MYLERTGPLGPLPNSWRTPASSGPEIIGGIPGTEREQGEFTCVMHEASNLAYH